MEGAMPPPEARTSSEPVFTNWEMHPRPPVFEGEQDETEQPPTRQVPRPREIPALPRPAQDQPEPRRPVPLFRVLVLLMFLLVPLFNSFLRNFVFDRPASGAPVLREAGFCERYSEGAPVNPKSTFSSTRDSQAVLYTEWRGTHRNHAVSVRWYTPPGELFPEGNSEIHYQDGSGEFAAVSVFPLQAGMAEGQWRAEVLLDGQLRASLKFNVRE